MTLTYKKEYHELVAEKMELEHQLKLLNVQIEVEKEKAVDAALAKIAALALPFPEFGPIRAAIQQVVDIQIQNGGTGVHKPLYMYENMSASTPSNLDIVRSLWPYIRARIEAGVTVSDIYTGLAAQHRIEMGRTAFWHHVNTMKREDVAANASDGAQKQAPKAKRKIEVPSFDDLARTYLPDADAEPERHGSGLFSYMGIIRYRWALIEGAIRARFTLYPIYKEMQRRDMLHGMPYSTFKAGVRDEKRRLAIAEEAATMEFETTPDAIADEDAKSCESVRDKGPAAWNL